MLAQTIVKTARPECVRGGNNNRKNKNVRATLFSNTAIIQTQNCITTEGPNEANDAHVLHLLAERGVAGVVGQVPAVVRTSTTTTTTTTKSSADTNNNNDQ